MLKRPPPMNHREAVSRPPEVATCPTRARKLAASFLQQGFKSRGVTARRSNRRRWWEEPRTGTSKPDRTSTHTMEFGTTRRAASPLIVGFVRDGAVRPPKVQGQRHRSDLRGIIGLWRWSEGGPRVGGRWSDTPRRPHYRATWGIRP